VVGVGLAFFNFVSELLGLTMTNDIVVIEDVSLVGRGGGGSMDG
jgi:hypothetical protein